MRLTGNQQRQTTINLISGILAMIINLVANFFLSPYIVSTLGEEANGFTQLANNFVTYASLITLSFNSMAARFMTVSYHKGNFDKVKEYYSSVILSNVIICLLLIPIAAYIIKNVNNLIEIQNADVKDVQILFACVFANFFANLAISVFTMSMYVTNTIYIHNIINLIRNILNAVLLLCVFMILPPKVFYISLIVFVLSVAAIPIVWYYQKKLMPKLKFSYKNFSIDAIGILLKSGIWNTVNQCGNMLMTGMDLLLTNIFISPAMMGVLSVAKLFPNAILNLATTINNNFAPSITIDWANGSSRSFLKNLRKSMKISSVIVSIPVITFCMYGIEFYSLWMPTLDPKVLTVLSFLSCMTLVPWAGPYVLYNVFTAANKLKVNSVAFVCTGIANIIVVYLCLKYTSLGVFAVAGVSTSLSIIRNLVVTAPYIAKILGLKWYEFYKDVGISLICCAVNAIIALFIINLICWYGWAAIIFKVCITAFITFIADMFFILNKDERKLLINKFTRKLKK